MFFVPADVEQSHRVSVSAVHSRGKGPGKCLSYGDFPNGKLGDCQFIVSSA
jgi:hypothetical protein